MRHLALSLLCLPTLLSADSIYYDQAAWTNALAPGDQVVTTDFAGNRLNGPVTITTCFFGGSTRSCQNLPAGGDHVGNGLIHDGVWTDAVGYRPLNPYIAKTSPDMQTVFNLPIETYAVGFQISVGSSAAFNSDPGNSAFEVALLGANPSDNQYLWPFGGGSIITGQPSNAYDGWFGAISSGNPYTGIGFYTGDTPYTISLIDIDPPAEGAVTPEPLSAGLTGLAFIGLWFVLRRRRHANA